MGLCHRLPEDSRPGLVREGGGSNPPVARIPEVAVDGPVADLGDEGQPPLVLAALNQAENPVHDLFGESELDNFQAVVAVIDQIMEDGIHFTQEGGDKVSALLFRCLQDHELLPMADGSGPKRRPR